MKLPMLFLVLVLVLGLAGCENKAEEATGSTALDEPPMALGGSTPGQNIRETKLVDLKIGEEIVYEVTYPVFGLKSTVRLGFVERGMREEVFDKKWKVVYEYSKQWRECDQIPAGFSIYKYSEATGKYDTLVNHYSLVEPGSKCTYKDSSGRKKHVDSTYFILLGHMGGN